MEEIASVAPAEVSAQAAPPVEEVEARQAEEAEAVPAEALPEAPPEPDAVVALPPPETVVAKPPEEKPAPKPARKPPPAKPVERKPEPHRTVAAQQLPPSQARQGQASASRENTGGAAASADPNALNRYVASLASALRNRLRYPDIARSQGVGGIATLRFTMDRSGRILSASVVRSAGHPALDQAALAAARPGSSLPPAPASLPQQQFTFSVPLRFDLR
ncbi:energy transducer TonB [Microvirga aerilata]